MYDFPMHKIHLCYEFFQKIKAKRAARNHRYMSVMRALIWRYVTAMTQSSLDRNVTEDDVNEVKGDISSFR